jgi:hypothetical protein
VRQASERSLPALRRGLPALRSGMPRHGCLRVHQPLRPDTDGANQCAMNRRPIAGSTPPNLPDLFSGANLDDARRP